MSYYLIDYEIKAKSNFPIEFNQPLVLIVVLEPLQMNYQRIGELFDNNSSFIILTSSPPPVIVCNYHTGTCSILSRIQSVPVFLCNSLSKCFLLGLLRGPETVRSSQIFSQNISLVRCREGIGFEFLIALRKYPLATFSRSSLFYHLFILLLICRLFHLKSRLRIRVNHDDNLH